MNAKQCKRARAVAFQEAKRRGLWKKGEAEVYGKWWRRLLAKFFPKFRKQYGDWVGRWYKRVVKDWSKQVVASVHDKDWQALQKARANMKRQEERQARVYRAMVEEQRQKAKRDYPQAYMREEA